MKWMDRKYRVRKKYNKERQKMVNKHINKKRIENSYWGYAKEKKKRLNKRTHQTVRMSNYITEMEENEEKDKDKEWKWLREKEEWGKMKCKTKIRNHNN